MAKPPVPNKLFGNGVEVTLNFPLSKLYHLDNQGINKWKKIGLMFKWDPTEYPQGFILDKIKGNTLGEQVANFKKCLYVNRSRLVKVNNVDMRILRKENIARKALENEMMKTLEFAKDNVLRRKYFKPGSDYLQLTFLNPPKPDGHLFGAKGIGFYGQSNNIRMQLRPKSAALLLDRNAMNRRRMRRLLSQPSLRKIGSNRKTIQMEQMRQRSDGLSNNNGSFKSSMLTNNSSLGTLNGNDTMSSRPKTASGISRRENENKYRIVNRTGVADIKGGSFGKALRPFDKPVPEVHMGTMAVPSATGKQILSTLRNSTCVSIGFSTREEWRVMNEGRGGRFAIADGSVPVSFSAFGRQVNSEKKSVTGVDFGASKRGLPPYKGLDKGIDSPGPVLPQGSTLTGGRITFGFGKRKTLATNKGLDSPGPVYSPIFLDAIGRDPEKGCSFGQTERPLHGKSWTPGPGEYVLPVNFGPDINPLVGPKMISARFGKNNCYDKKDQFSQQKFYYGSSADHAVNHDVLWKTRIKEENRIEALRNKSNRFK